MKEKKVSIVVPVYNVEKYLKKCLDSILSQNYKNLEVVVVDDGSTDNCGKICDEYAKKNKNLIVIHKQNGGITSAWLAGLEKVSGEYLTFIDSDDWIEPNSISSMVSKLEDRNADIAIFDYYDAYDKFRIPKKGNLLGINGLKTGEELEKIKKVVVEKANICLPFFKWNKLFKTDLLMKNLNYNVQIDCFDDVIISLASILDAKSIYFGNEKFVNYYQRQNSTTHKLNKKFLTEYLIYLNGLKKLLIAKKVYDEKSFVFEEARTLVFLFEQVFAEKLKDEKDIVEKIKREAPFKEVVSSKYFSELTVFRKTLLKFVNKGKYKSARFLVKIREIIVKTRMKFKRKEKNGK